MPTITTTVTSAAASGVVTTVTSTEATPEPAAAVATAATTEAAASPSGVRVPQEKEEITPEWLTAALHEGGHLPKKVKVATMEPLKNIGEGRGYANYSWILSVSTVTVHSLSNSFFFSLLLELDFIHVRALGGRCKNSLLGSDPVRIEDSTTLGCPLAFPSLQSVL